MNSQFLPENVCGEEIGNIFTSTALLLKNEPGAEDIFIYIYISDYVVVGSDSGRIVILEYLAQKNLFDKVKYHFT